MNFLKTSVILIICGCSLVAGHYSHHGGHGKEVGYSVVTDHGLGHGGDHDGGHYGGHDGGHYGGHYGGDGGYGGHGKEVGYSVVTDHGHNYGHSGHDGGHDAGHISVHDWSHAGHGHYAAAYHGGHYESYDQGHGGHYGGHGDDGHDYHAYPKYEFAYGVKDTKTGDIKSHKEERDGGHVRGKKFCLLFKENTKIISILQAVIPLRKLMALHVT